MTAEKMSNAEKQRRYRERKRALPLPEGVTEPLRAVVYPGPERPLAKGPLLRLVEALYTSRQISTPVRRQLLDAIHAA